LKSLLNSKINEVEQESRRLSKQKESLSSNFQEVAKKTEELKKADNDIKNFTNGNAQDHKLKL
jgi:prefoldin subunit 5